MVKFDTEYRRKDSTLCGPSVFRAQQVGEVVKALEKQKRLDLL